MRIRRAKPEEVRYACKNFHYTHAVPACKYSYSIFNGEGLWCGVVIYSSGASPQLGKKYGLFQGEFLELVRVALNGKQESTSKAVALTLRKLRKDAPKVRLIISFADTEQGHAGTIYQATNWMYVGKMDGAPMFVVNGKRYHYKSCIGKGWKNSEKWLRDHVDPNAKEVRGGDKHKYLYFFDRKLKKEFTNLSQPYPKKTEDD